MRTVLISAVFAYVFLPVICYRYGDDGVVPYSTIRLRRRLYAKRRHRNICDLENDEKNNEKLREIVRKSDYVFTGKVLAHVDEGGTRGGEESNAIRRFDREEDRSRTFQVEVKRAMKGGHALGGRRKVIVRVPKEFVSGVELTSDAALNTNCIEFHPVLKLRQTAILLAREVSPGHLELTSFPVAMTLRHLDRVDAAVAGKLSVFSLCPTDTSGPSERVPRFPKLNMGLIYGSGVIYRLNYVFNHSAICTMKETLISFPHVRDRVTLLRSNEEQRPPPTRQKELSFTKGTKMFSLYEIL